MRRLRQNQCICVLGHRLGHKVTERFPQQPGGQEPASEGPCSLHSSGEDAPHLFQLLVAAAPQLVATSLLPLLHMGFSLVPCPLLLCVL